ncbi:MAG: hypothetical protein PHO37_13745 [Kiritimatiellae bacterium]|nr:hypothetical protein [Kiritimatiellia bacterium]MDD4213043.1 hypothetical protein [Bacilli bacterium]
MSKVEKLEAKRSFYSQIKGYSRLMRVGSAVAGRLTVYGNSERLALVSADGFREHVKYIEYSNIRAVLIERHTLALKILLLLLVTVGALALILLGSDGFTPLVALCTFLGAALFGALILALRNCSMRIVTDVYDHYLAQVSRYRKARQLLAIISANMEPYLERSEG